MNKELIVTLLQKDIAELALLTKGFETMEIYPESLLELAQAKTKNIEICLQQLHDQRISDVTLEKPKVEESIPEMIPSIEKEQPVAIEELITKLEEPEPVEEKSVVEEYEPEKEVNREPIAEVKTSVVTRNDMIHNQKIDDVKQAISIGDRFLFQRELFGGSGELMSKTIAILNACKTWEDAEQYIAKKFQWDMENTTTERFMQIISRKF